MGIRTVIVDDELAIIQGLSKMLTVECPDVEIVGCATSVHQAKQILLSKPVDLLLLDIKLGESSGFNLLKEISTIDFQVIFITAHDEFAVEAFRFSALDFLLKPVDPDQLVAGVKKVEQEILRDSLQLRMQSLLYNNTHSILERTLVLKTSEAFHVVKMKDIIQCQAQGNYTLFHLRQSNPILTSHTLKKYDELLSKYGFFRCHQSHLVNITHIIKYDKRHGGSLILLNDHALPVSPKKKEQLFTLLASISEY